MNHKIIFFFTLLISVIFFIPNHATHYTINFDLDIKNTKEIHLFTTLDDMLIPIIATKTKKQTTQENCQFFYASKHTAYTGALFQNINCSNTQNIPRKISLEINGKKPYENLRFDLPEGKYKATITKLTLSFLFMQTTIIFDAPEILKKRVHNIDIVQHTDHSITFKSNGTDPFIELSKDAHIKYYYILLMLYIIMITMIIYLCLFFFYHISTEAFLALLIFTYTAYTVWGMYDVRFYYILPLVTLYRAIIHNYLSFYFSKPIFYFTAIYLSWSSLSMFLPVPLANIHYYYETVPLFIASILLLISVYKQGLNALFFKKFLTLLLLLFALTMILIHEGFIQNKDNILFGYLTFYTGPWLQKNYMFWYVLLTFGTLSFYNIKNKKELLIILSILILSYFALYHGYSKSAMLAFITSTVIYLTLSFIEIKKRYLLLMVWLMTLYIIFSPILFSFIDLSPYHPRLAPRNEIYHKSAALIKEHWFLGYGYGSTLLIDIRNFLHPDNIMNYKNIFFRGGHPHNLSLLFWLEFGILGALFLAYYIHKLLHFIVECTYGTSKIAALLAMFVALDIISAFSWSIWYPKVLHTFAFFGIILTISLNSRYKKLS